MKLKKKTKIIVTATFLVVASILLIILFTYSSPQLVIPQGYGFHTESSLLTQNSNSATYSFKYITDGPSGYGGFPSCGDPQGTQEIDFNAESHPTRQSALPIFVEGLQQNVDFNAMNIEITPLKAQTNSVCNTNNIEALTAVYEDTGTTCSIIGGQYGIVSCHFRGNIKAYNSEGQQRPAIYGWVTELSADVRILKEGIVEDCSGSQSKCEGNILFTCTPDNTWGQVGASPPAVKPDGGFCSDEPPITSPKIWVYIVGTIVLLIVIVFVIYKLLKK